MRILAVVPGEEGGASMIFAKRQAASLEDAGHELSYFFLQSRMSPLGLCREGRRLARSIAETAPDAVHAHYGTVTAFLSVLVSRKPVVVSYRGSDLNPCAEIGWFRWAAGHLLSQLAALGARRIVCVSPALRDRLWWRRDRVSVITSGVDVNRFRPRPRDEARRVLGWALEAPTIIFNASRAPRIKRLKLAQAAVDRARERVPGLEFVVLNGHVDPERIPVMFSAADCLLLTSRNEGSPNVVKEAMACNLPVVSVDVGDARTRLEGVTESSVTGETPAELADALVEIVTRRRRSNGREFVDSISLENVARELVAVFAELERS